MPLDARMPDAGALVRATGIAVPASAQGIPRVPTVVVDDGIRSKLLVWLIDSMRIGLMTLSRISLSITVTLLFWLFFFRSGWKWPGLRLTFDRPRIEGTWVGCLQSNWQDDGSTADPGLLLPIVFVIRQTFSTLVIQSFTRKQEGLSDTARLVVRPESNTIYVAYTYALRRGKLGQVVRQMSPRQLDQLAQDIEHQMEQWEQRQRVDHSHDPGRKPESQGVHDSQGSRG